MSGSLPFSPNISIFSISRPYFPQTITVARVYRTHLLRKTLRCEKTDLILWYARVFHPRPSSCTVTRTKIERIAWMKKNLSLERTFRTPFCVYKPPLPHYTSIFFSVKCDSPAARGRLAIDRSRRREKIMFPCSRGEDLLFILQFMLTCKHSCRGLSLGK